MRICCFGGRENYTKLKNNFKLGDIIYEISIDTATALNELIAKGFECKTGGKDNILVQNVLTNAVFGAAPVVGRWRTGTEVCHDLNDGQRGIEFKQLSVKADIFRGLSTIPISSQSLANKVWGRTSKLGIYFQIFNRGRTVHFIVDNLLPALHDIATKSGVRGRCVTAAEIRYLYRMRNLSVVRHNIRLYTKHRKVGFDEFFEAPQWYLYKPKHELIE